MAVMRHCGNCQTPLEAAEEDLSDAAPSPLLIGHESWRQWLPTKFVIFKQNGSSCYCEFRVSVLVR